MECKKCEQAEVDGEFRSLRCQWLRDNQTIRQILLAVETLTFESASSRSHTSKKYFANSVSEIGSPLILILSLTAHR